jgi:AraC-like DNA-binding protein
MWQFVIDKILLIGAFQAFFLAALIFRKKSKARHDYLMGVWLIFLGIYVSVYSIAPQDYFVQRPWLIKLYLSMLLLNGPFLLGYVSALIQSDFKLSSRLFLHFIPFLLVLSCLFFFISSSDILSAAETSRTLHQQKIPLLFLLVLFVVAISVPYYIVWTERLLKRHRQNVADEFSSLGKVNLIWLRNLILLLGIAWISLVVIFFIHHVLLLFPDDFCINGLFLTLSVFVILVGYFGLNQPAIFTVPNTLASSKAAKEDTKYTGSSLKEEDLQRYLIQLGDHLAKNKSFLNPQISLYQLAEETEIPAHYLSRIINEHHGQNFFDFINSFRIEEFKRRLADPHYKNFTLLAIAFDCGFNSKSAFNRFFKKVEGISPSEYKKIQQ